MGPLLFLSSFWFFLRGLAPGPVLGDSAELIDGAATLGVGHAPVHPLYLLAGRLLLALPAGSPAFRLNLLSAAAAAAAGLAAASLVRSSRDRRMPAAGIAAMLVWSVSRAPWWQAGAASSLPVAAALTGWSVVAARRHGAGGGAGWLALAALAAGLGLGMNILAVAAVPALVWGWGTADAPARGRRAGLAAAFCFLPLGGLAVAAAIRAHAHPAIDVGAPDTAIRLMHQVTAWPAAAPLVFTDHSAGRIASLLVQHGLAVPWQELGWLALLAGFGLWIARRETPAVWSVVMLVAAATVALGVGYQNPGVERGGLAMCWAGAVAAGLGTDWLLRRFDARVVAAALAILIGWQGWSARDQAVRDRDFLAPDLARDVASGMPAGSRLLAGADPWLLPLEWRRDVVGDPALRRLVPTGDLSADALSRLALTADAASGYRGIAGMQEGPALEWALARRDPALPVYLTPEQPPLILPSRGARWEGLLLRVTTPAEPLGLAPGQARRMGRLSLRGLLRPLGGFEPVQVRSVALALHTQAQAALRTGHPAEAEALVRLGLRLDPALPELHHALGRALLAQGKPGAGTWFTSALALTRGTYLDPYLGLAAVERDPDMALEDLHTAAALGIGAQHPDLAAADEARLGGHAEQARALYGRGIAAGFVSRGMVYFQEGKLPQAAQAWETALEHDPRQGQACHNLGTLAALEERFDDAIRWYERARTLGPRAAELEDNLAKAREARVWLGRLPALERAVAARPRSPVARCDLGNGYWYVGRSKPAEACFRAAIALDPGDVRAWGNLGSSLVHEGRVQEAIAVYSRALKVRPDYAEAMINLAAVYQVLGDYVRATDWAQRGLVLKPGDPAAARILKELAANH